MKWLIVAILFAGDVPLNSKIFGGPQIDADCEKERAEMMAEAKAMDVDVWAKCVEIVREEKKTALPKPDPRDGDGVSLDGKRRGQTL